MAGDRSSNWRWVLARLFRKGLAEEPEDSNARPQSGDRFVFADSLDVPKEITPADFVLGPP